MKLRALFVPTANSGVTYYRMYNFWVAAARRGLADLRVLWWQKKLHEMHPWEREVHDTRYMWRITKEIQDWAIKSDVVVFGMLHGPGVKVVSDDSDQYVSQSLGIFRALRDMFPTKPILTEIDDNILSTPEYNPVFKMYAPEQELRALALAQFRESTGLVVSTPYLAETYADFNSTIDLVPNCIDFKLWDAASRVRKRGIRIGWVGGANHDGDLALLQDIIPSVLARHPEVRFVFLHGCPHALRKLQGVEYDPGWADIDKYPKKVASLGLDIGIAPLVDNAFNRGKSNLRWLEYSALGIPTVASAVGHFSQTIFNGKDGLLADGARQFEDALEALITDRQLRKRIGGEAYRRVRSDFNVDLEVETYVSILERHAKAAEKEAAIH